MTIPKEYITSTVFIDFSKAFDCVHHGILLKKILSFGITGKAYELLKNYMTDRYQFVKLNNAISECHKIKYGVPQGSILAPTLFLIYINDIFYLPLIGKIQLFADDVAIAYSVNNLGELEACILHDLKVLEIWLIKHNLLMNITKTNMMIYNFGLTPDNIKLFEGIYFHNTLIKKVDMTKYLGLCIDNRLTWAAHIDQIIANVTPIVGALKRTSKYLTKTLCYQVYFSQIYSRIHYMISIWGAATTTKSESLQIVQNKAIKALFGLPRLTPSIELYTKNILPIKSCICIEYCLVIYKAVHNMSKYSIIPKTNIEVTQRNSRTADEFHLPRFIHSTPMNSIFYKGLLEFNNLNNEIKTQNIGAFKSHIRSIYLSKYRCEYNLNH